MLNLRLKGFIYFVILGLGMVKIHASPIYENLHLGMSIRAFNALYLAPGFETQKSPVLITRYGIVKLDSQRLTRYISLKNKDWKGFKVSFQNNQATEIVLQGHKWLNQHETHQVLSDMLRLYGTEFKGEPFVSWGREGYRLVWSTSTHRVAMNFVFNAKGECTLNIRKVLKEKRPEKESFNESDQILLALAEELKVDLQQLNTVSVAQ